MEVTSLYRSFTVVAPTPRVAPAAATDAVDTILPQASRSVAPVAPADASASGDQSTRGQGNPPPAQPAPATTDKTQVLFQRDASTETMVFMELDKNSNTVVMQYPDEQLLKLKSYLAEMARREGASRQQEPGTRLEMTM